jgi:type I restriction enzyme S subunit
MKSDKTTPNVPTLRFPNYNGEWQKTVMGKVCSFRKGYGIAKDDLSSDGTPCILYGELYTTYKTAIAKTIKSKTSIQSKSLVYSQKDDVIIPCSGETAEDIATSICVPYDGVLLGGDLTIVHSDLDGAFLSNQINSVRKYDIARIAQGKSIVHLQADELKKIFIFYPSIQEQRKISAFIDKIDERIEIQNKIISNYETLIKGLCDMIFRHNKSVSLSDLVKCKTSALQENTVSTCHRGEYKVLGASGAIAAIDTYQFEESGILVLKDGSKAGKIQFAQGKYSVVGTSVVLIPNEACDARYLYFAMSSIDFEKYKVGSGIPHIYFKDYSNERIYYPEKALRKKIIKTLDFYETRVEIEREMLSAMQKQKAFLLQSMFI